MYKFEKFDSDFEVENIWYCIGCEELDTFCLMLTTSVDMIDADLEKSSYGSTYVPYGDTEVLYERGGTSIDRVNLDVCWEVELLDDDGKETTKENVLETLCISEEELNKIISEAKRFAEEYLEDDYKEWAEDNPDYFEQDYGDWDV